MTINELLKALNYIDENSTLNNINLNDYGSDRGNYSDFYIGESVVTMGYTVKDLKDFLVNNVIGKTFCGYKGGKFLMDENTDIVLSSYSCCGFPIDGILVQENGVIIKPLKILYY